MHLERAPSLNDEPVFLRALADLVSEHLVAHASGEQGPTPWTQTPTSRQMSLRCPGCTNETCAEQKMFFGAQL